MKMVNNGHALRQHRLRIHVICLASNSLRFLDIHVTFRRTEKEHAQNTFASAGEQCHEPTVCVFRGAEAGLLWRLLLLLR